MRWAEVALYLLYLYLATDNQTFLAAERKGLEFDLSYGRAAEPAQSAQSGELEASDAQYLSFPADAGSSSILYPYWFRGSAGVGTCLLRYAALTGERVLWDKLALVLADVRRKYTVYPGLFNGLAGLGNFLLDCHQLTGDIGYLEWAKIIAEGVLLFKIERDTGVAFPGDDLVRLSCDFGTGSAGIGLFLSRLVNHRSDRNFILGNLDELLLNRAQVPAARG